MKSRTWMWSTAICLFAALAITVQTSSQKRFAKFDPPGSITTQPSSINPTGAITGWYEDSLVSAQTTVLGSTCQQLTATGIYAKTPAPKPGPVGPPTPKPIPPTPVIKWGV